MGVMIGRFLEGSGLRVSGDIGLQPAYGESSGLCPRELC